MTLKLNAVVVVVLCTLFVNQPVDAAQWDVFSGAVYDSGLWRVNGNWDTGIYPDAPGAVASFPDMTAATGPGNQVLIDVDADVTFGEIFLGISRNSGSRWRLAGSGLLIPDSGNAVDRALIHGGRITAGGLSAIVDNDIEIPDNRLLQINARSSDSTTTYNGAITGASGQDIDLLLSSDNTFGNLIFTNNNNDFGNGTITGTNGVRPNFQNAADVANPGVSGGSSTTITMVDAGYILTFGTSADADFGSNVILQANGSLNALRIGADIRNDVTIGDLTLAPGITVNIGHTWGHSLVIGAGDVMTMGAGSVITQTNSAGGHSGDLKIDGTLQGSGTIGFTSGTTSTQSTDLVIRNGGTLAPGESTGILNLVFESGDTGDTNYGSLILAPSATMEMEINGLTAGTNYDQIVTTDATSVDLGGATLELLITEFNLGQSDNYLWLLINETGTTSVFNTFAGLSEGDVAATIGGEKFRIHYGADFASGALVGGNDIVLFSAAVPEPSSAMLLLLGVLGLSRIRRRRREV